jgi:hypothetical protein
MLLEPHSVEYESDTYTCELSYNNKPMLINNVPSCIIESVIHDRYIYLSINKHYALFFDKLYNELINHIHTNGKNWFEDELTMDEIESSLIHPLKINIRDNTYDLKLKLNERFYCTDSDGNITLPDLNQLLINPVIHIKSVIFGTKQFYIEIELISCSIPNNNSESNIGGSEETNIGGSEESNIGGSEETNNEASEETNNEASEETNNEVYGIQDIYTEDLQEGVISNIIENEDSIEIDTHSDINILIDTKIRNNIITYLKNKALSNRTIKFNLEEQLFESDYLLND